MADAFARMPDSARKSALAIELFGESGAKLLPFLNQAKAGLLDLGRQAEQLGIVLTQDQANIGDALGDSLDSVSKAIAGVRLQLGLIFAPGITALANGFAEVISKNREALVEFGQAVNQRVLSIVGDLLHILSGNPQNVKNPWIRDWAEAIVQFGKDVYAVVTNVVIPLFKALQAGAQFVADQINKLFGTDFNGNQILITAFFVSVLGLVSALVTGIGVLIGLFSFIGGIPGLIAAAAVGVGIALAVFWDDIKAAAASAWQYIVDQAAAGWQAIADGATSIWNNIAGAFDQGQQLAVSSFNQIVDAIVSAWNGLIDRLGQIAQQIVDRIVGAFQAITQRIAAILDGVVDIARSVLGRVSSLVDSILSKIKSAINYAKQLAGLGGDSGASGGGSSARGFANGGLIRGAGGPKSDNILAWLSPGEFVLQASAVKKLGLDVVYALNQGFLPSLKGLQGFSLGGFVETFNRSMTIPRFAGGGLASATLAPAESTTRTPLHFHFDRGEEVVIDAVGIANFTLGRLQKLALESSRTNAGRAPRRGT